MILLLCSFNVCTDAVGRSQLKELQFSWQDYLVFAVSLTIPLGVGIFFFFYKRKQQSTESFLVGDRSLNVVAVGMSLTASILNGIFIIGLSAEMHYHGVEMTYMVIASTVVAVVSAHVFIPRYHRMKFTSAYEVRRLIVRYHVETTLLVTRGSRHCNILLLSLVPLQDAATWQT